MRFIDDVCYIEDDDPFYSYINLIFRKVSYLYLTCLLKYDMHGRNIEIFFFYWNKKGLLQEGRIDDESNNSISKSLSEHRKVLG